MIVDGWMDGWMDILELWLILLFDKKGKDEAPQNGAVAQLKEGRDGCFQLSFGGKAGRRDRKNGAHF